MTTIKQSYLDGKLGRKVCRRALVPDGNKTPPRVFSRPIRNLITTPNGKAPLLKSTIKRIGTYGASCVIQNLSVCPVFSTARKRPYCTAQKRSMTITVSLPGNHLVHKVVTRRRHDITCNALWCHGLWHFPHISFRSTGTVYGLWHFPHISFRSTGTVYTISVKWPYNTNI
jgi:hypothetical protein